MSMRSASTSQADGRASRRPTRVASGAAKARATVSIGRLARATRKARSDRCSPRPHAHTRRNAGPQPFHGYYFRILEAQGPSAPGGARSYLDKKDRLTRGFAAIAWPSKHGNSGVMTFQVNQQGIVFQKDLGPETETAVAAIEAYDPDESWHPTGD